MFHTTQLASSTKNPRFTRSSALKNVQENAGRPLRKYFHSPTRPLPSIE